MYFEDSNRCVRGWHPLSKHKISFDKGTGGRVVHGLQNCVVGRLYSYLSPVQFLACHQIPKWPLNHLSCLFFYHNKDIYFQTHFWKMFPNQCTLCVWSGAENICDHFETSATVLSRFHRCLRISYYSQMCFLLQKSRLIALPDQLLTLINALNLVDIAGLTIDKPLRESGMFKIRLESAKQTNYLIYSFKFSISLTKNSKLLLCFCLYYLIHSKKSNKKLGCSSCSSSFYIKIRTHFAIYSGFPFALMINDHTTLIYVFDRANCRAFKTAKCIWFTI